MRPDGPVSRQESNKGSKSADKLNFRKSALQNPVHLSPELAVLDQCCQKLPEPILQAMLSWSKLPEPARQALLSAAQLALTILEPGLSAASLRSNSKRTMRISKEAP